MKHFVDRATGEIFAYEDDGSQDEFIKEGLELLSVQELGELRKAQDDAAAPTPEQRFQAACIRRDELLTVAGLRIAPLQDAIDLGKATDTDISTLKLWKQYRVDLNGVGQQVGFPESTEWPLPPE